MGQEASKPMGRSPPPVVDARLPSIAIDLSSGEVVQLASPPISPVTGENSGARPHRLVRRSGTPSHVAAESPRTLHSANTTTAKSGKPPRPGSGFLYNGQGASTHAVDNTVTASYMQSNPRMSSLPWVDIVVDDAPKRSSAMMSSAGNGTAAAVAETSVTRAVEQRRQAHRDAYKRYVAGLTSHGAVASALASTVAANRRLSSPILGKAMWEREVTASDLLSDKLKAMVRTQYEIQQLASQSAAQQGASVVDVHFPGASVVFGEDRKVIVPVAPRTRLPDYQQSPNLPSLDRPTSETTTTSSATAPARKEDGWLEWKVYLNARRNAPYVLLRHQSPDMSVFEALSLLSGNTQLIPVSVGLWRYTLAVVTYRKNKRVQHLELEHTAYLQPHAQKFTADEANAGETGLSTHLVLCRQNVFEKRVTRNHGFNKAQRSHQAFNRTQQQQQPQESRHNMEFQYNNSSSDSEVDSFATSLASST